MSIQPDPAFRPFIPVTVQNGVSTTNSTTAESLASTALSSLSLPKLDPLPTNSTTASKPTQSSALATRPTTTSLNLPKSDPLPTKSTTVKQPTQSSAVTRPTTSASHFSKKHAVPIEIATPIVFSVLGVAALIFYYYYRQQRKYRRMLLPDTIEHGGENQIVRGMEGSLGRFNILERHLEPGKRHQAPEPLPDIATEGYINNPQQNVETMGRTHNGPQAQPQSLADQVEALQERLRAMEDTMNSERNLREFVPPPEYSTIIHLPEYRAEDQV